ncbi:hypothetical protein CERSUDRAFT_91150 [Gelatoporia subvermispora B]|uniref:Uncharacterized protein n=1 Tax=Ceriporiopsis subvermispora (strain B) TaxID=914234 RepID=M2R7P4_CERS8|nr:hypothetical protein CERSUDRAFT_91150 [Gelatoporia subvermispora B]
MARRSRKNGDRHIPAIEAGTSVARPSPPRDTRGHGVTHDDHITNEGNPRRLSMNSTSRIPPVDRATVSPSVYFPNRETPFQEIDLSEYLPMRNVSPRSAEFGSAGDEKSFGSVSSWPSRPQSSASDKGEQIVKLTDSTKRDDEPAVPGPLPPPPRPFSFLDPSPPKAIPEPMKFKRCKICEKTVLDANLVQHRSMHRGQGVQLESGPDIIDNWYDVYELD